MYVAMKDLEIRGAGNLLGGEQSGHIAGVGFDLYVRMVGEAVADYRASLEGGESRRSRRWRSRSSCRSTRTSRTTTRRASGCACRPTAPSPPPTRRRTSRPYARNSSTATASCPSRWRTCCWWRGLRHARPRVRRRRDRAPGQQHPLRAGGAARVAGAAAQAAYPGTVIKPAAAPVAGAPARRPRRSAESRWSGGNCWAGWASS